MDIEKANLAKWISQYHFSIREHGTGVAICARCVEETWPCRPIRLARIVAEEELAK